METLTNYQSNTLNPDPVPKGPIFISQRGLFGQDSTLESAEKIDALLDCLTEIGADTLYAPVLYKGTAFYHSNLMPYRDFDSWAYLVPKAHAQGIKVYAWLYVGYMGWQQHPEWNAHLNYAKVPDDWLDLSIPEAREFVSEVAYEVVDRYNADGVLLDYIRWKYWWRKAGLDPQDIDETVRIIYARLNKAVPLTAAVSANYSESQDRGQLWHEWLSGDYIDFVEPMAYSNDDELYEFLEEWKDSGYFPERIVPILATAFFSLPSEPPKSPNEVLRQIRIIQLEGATGIVLFDDLSSCKNKGLLKALSQGGW